ncbi:hypothetical protein Q0590_32610 [Rhodocytophaga aerolata]|uniref:Uncharacterized protein n=1 Tax=Rhodocytophaga aerolata TaxID=455078 RepID=A0ABT8RJS9_9BACT|nr:hypothetical protein [Rhodocytophaga aerolata]MDO1451062.1 hypothetical protein [Rhodocytophaga aerolata]
MLDANDVSGKMLTEQQKRDFCALMLRRYGVQLETVNELLPAFYVNYLAASISEKTSKESRESIIMLFKSFAAETQKAKEEFVSHSGQAITQITSIVSEFEKNTASKVANFETKQYRFDDPKTAFFFAFGKYGIAGCFVSLLLFICFMVMYLNR